MKSGKRGYLFFAADNSPVIPVGRAGQGLT